MQAEWVALNYVPFAERSLEVVVDLYHKTACHKAVINEQVLQNIIKVFFNPTGISMISMVTKNYNGNNKTKSTKNCLDAMKSQKTENNIKRVVWIG